MSDVVHLPGTTAAQVKNPGPSLRGRSTKNVVSYFDVLRRRRAQQEAKNLAERIAGMQAARAQRDLVSLLNHMLKRARSGTLDGLLLVARLPDEEEKFWILGNFAADYPDAIETLQETARALSDSL